MTIAYTAVERFGRGHHAWPNYEIFSGLHQVADLVTLDAVLCGTVIDNVFNEDWKYNLADEDMLFCFRDLDYLLKRARKKSGYQILAVVKNPATPPTFDDPRFDFIGYDLVEKGGGISALTNCGGFDNAFRTDELSIHGLIPTFEDAVRIDALLRQNYPDEPHAFCDMFAVWRMRSDT